MSEESSVELTVRAAEKRDAGRGIARLPEPARKRLGVLSGDTLRIEGERTTVAKMWPARADTPDGVILVDADVRANAGVRVGDAVRVSKVAVADARSVTFRAPESLRSADVGLDTVERVVKSDVRNRPVSQGEQVRIERLGGYAFVVTSTDPDGTVRVTDDTAVTLSIPGGEVDAGDRDATAGRGAADAQGEVGPRADRERGGDGAKEPTKPTTGVAYEDIGGLDEELDLVREMIELPLSEPELFTRLGVEPPKGVLLYGPPGTGKTLIAKAVANEVDATFISISGPEIMSKYKGESEERLRETFENAAENAPAIIFFDEIDSIAGKRDDAGDVENRVVGQLLSLMDGLDARGDVIVVGATNRVDDLDPALRRGGRFDREIEIGVPGETGRREILDVHTRNMPLADDVDLDALASRTHGFTGADLASLAKEAAMTALRRSRRASGVRGDASDADEAEDANDGTDTDGRDDGPRTGSDSLDDGEPDDPDGGGGADGDAAARAVAIEDLEVTRADFEAAMTAIDPSAMREYVAETPTTTFDQVGGLEEAKRTLERSVTWPLTYGPLFEAANANPPTGVLLWGPPGTGKTLLARAIAGESGVNFVHVAGPELLDRYVGESEKAVREVFERARQAAPTIVFFDEIDAIAGDRDAGSGDSGVGDRVVSQLLTELDRLADNPNLVVLAATNRRDALDPALLRAGRLESHVEVPAPDGDARRAILDVHTREKPLADDVDLADLAVRTEGFSGADLNALCREAAMLAIREVTERYDGPSANAHADEVLLEATHFEQALASIDPSLG